MQRRIRRDLGITPVGHEHVVRGALGLLGSLRASGEGGTASTDVAARLGLEALDLLVAERDQARRALRAISENANSYHGDADAKQRALNVIGAWATWPDSIPDGVAS